MSTLVAPHPDPGHAVDRTAARLWFTLSVIPQSQAHVRQRARELGIETYAPMSRTPPHLRKFGRRRVIEAEIRPLMPGYVFVAMPTAAPRFDLFQPCHGARAAIEPVRGCLGFLSSADGPTPVHEAIIEDIRLRERSGEFDLMGHMDRGRGFVAKWVQVGAWVELIDGPFSGFCGVIEEIVNPSIVKLEARIFGRVTRMTVPLDWARLARSADHGLLISRKKYAKGNAQFSTALGDRLTKQA